MASKVCSLEQKRRLEEGEKEWVVVEEEVEEEEVVEEEGEWLPICDSFCLVTK